MSPSEAVELSSTLTSSPSMAITAMNAVVYILSGVAQALIMTVVNDAGLADASCQLYMLFYCLGPASVVLPLLCSPKTKWPNVSTALRAGGIAIIDVGAGSLNYTGLTLCGPTYFSIIYSSVTIWAAVYSYLLLDRSMNRRQWAGVFIVFAGLALTALESVSVGPAVFRGSLMVILGSSIHASVYVFSEWIMKRGHESLSVSMNCAVQSIVGFLAYALWQVVYTRKHFHDLIVVPMDKAGTSAAIGWALLSTIAFANLIHSLTFYSTVKEFPGGSTSAGIMKGLQAVLVFLIGSWTFCGRTGGSEMCFTTYKCFSLLVVVGGILVYSKATEHEHASDAHKTTAYDAIPDASEIPLHDLVRSCEATDRHSIKNTLVLLPS